MSRSWTSSSWEIWYFAPSTHKLTHICIQAPHSLVRAVLLVFLFVNFLHVFFSFAQRNLAALGSKGKKKAGKREKASEKDEQRDANYNEGNDDGDEHKDAVVDIQEHSSSQSDDDSSDDGDGDEKGGVWVW
jgi:hypothetical protein